MEFIKKLIPYLWRAWNRDKLTDHAASLSYYTLFSLSPLLLFSISLLGLFFGQTEAQHNILFQIKSVMGPDAAQTFLDLMKHVPPSTSGFASLISIATMILGAIGILTHLEDSLNSIWNIEVKKRNILERVKNKLFTFSLIFFVILIVVITSILSTLFNQFSSLFNMLPESLSFTKTMNISISFLATLTLFSLIFKILPDVRLRTKDVIVGGLFTSFLFLLGRSVLGYYLTHNAPTSTYGAAGSLIALLLWIYYSSLILFIGAEFTKFYSQRILHPRRV